MTERIYVSYSTATASYGNGPVIGNHMILNYVDASGTHRVVEGRPENPFISTLDKARATIAEVISGPEINRDSAFGRLVGESREGNTTTDPTRPFENIATGADLSGQWAAVLTFMNRVNAEGYEYRPTAQNSNSFVTGALAAAGLSSPTQFAYDPQDGHQKYYTSPGAGEALSYPWSAPAVVYPSTMEGFHESWITGADGVTAVTWTRQSMVDGAAALINSVTARLDDVAKLLTVSTAFASGTRMDRTFDEFGNLDVVSKFSIQGALLSVADWSAEDSVVTTTFDPTNAQPWSSQTTHADAAGHVTETITVDDGGASLRSLYGSDTILDLVEESGADGLFDRVTTYDAGGRADTMQLFSVGGSVAAAFYYDDAGRTDLRYDYDASGHVEIERRYDDGGTMTLQQLFDDAARVDVRYDYDAFGRMDAERRYDDQGVMLLQTTYDDGGVMRQRLDYDAVGRLDVYRTYDTAGRLDDSFTYDDASILRTRSTYDDASRLVTYTTYDALARVDDVFSYYDTGVMSARASYDDLDHLDVYRTFDTAGRGDEVFTFDDNGITTTRTTYGDDGLVDFYRIFDEVGRMDTQFLFDDLGLAEWRAAYDDAGRADVLYHLTSSGWADRALLFNDTSIRPYQENLYFADGSSQARYLDGNGRVTGGADYGISGQLTGEWTAGGGSFMFHINIPMNFDFFA